MAWCMALWLHCCDSSDATAAALAPWRPAVHCLVVLAGVAPRSSFPSTTFGIVALGMSGCCCVAPAASDRGRNSQRSRAMGRAAAGAARAAGGPCLLINLLDHALLSDSIAALLSARDLGRLACTSRHFTAPLNQYWPSGFGGTVAGHPIASIIERAAELACRSHPRTMRFRAPPRATTWLRLLAELDTPAFTTANGGIRILERGKVVCGPGTAVCDTPEMHSGVHRAEFSLVEACTASIGVVGAAFSLENTVEGGLSSTLLSSHAWLFNTGRGRLYHGGRGQDWPGRPKARRKTAMVRGDTLGLQLDLDQRTLTVVLNGRVLGVMVRGNGAFVPPLRWCVHLEGGGGTAAPPTLRLQATVL